jgi:hypothetical protein
MDSEPIAVFRAESKVEREKEGREMVFSTLANDDKRRTHMELSQFSEEEIMEIEPLEVQRREVSRGEGLNTHFSILEGEEEKIGCSHVWSGFLPLGISYIGHKL